MLINRVQRRHWCVAVPKTCYQSVESYRMPWLPSTLVVDDPLASYLPPDCCVPTDQGRPFNAQRRIIDGIVTWFAILISS